MSRRAAGSSRASGAGAFAPLVLLLLAACSSPPPPAAPEPAPVSPRVERLNRLWLLGTAQGSSTAELRRSLGAAASVQQELVPNRHVEAQDTLTTVIYPGRRFHFLKSGANGRQFLIQSEFDDGDVQLPGGLRVGQSDAGAVRTALGTEESMRLAGDTLILSYQRPESEVEDHLEFAFVAGRLLLLRWLPYVD